MTSKTIKSAGYFHIESWVTDMSRPDPLPWMGLSRESWLNGTNMLDMAH